jgi:hypothetical protein
MTGGADDCIQGMFFSCRKNLGHRRIFLGRSEHIVRVARFFFTEYTKTGENIPNLPLNYEMAINYSKWP